MCLKLMNFIWRFQIIFPERYPMEAPLITCLTDIYHPNISKLRYASHKCNVCLNILYQNEWSSSLNLEDCIQGILFLLYNPNLDDPLSRFDGGHLDEETFKANLHKSLTETRSLKSSFTSRKEGKNNKNSTNKNSTLSRRQRLIFWLRSLRSRIKRH